MLEFYEDKGAQLKIENILELDHSDWQLSHVAIPSFGFTSSAYWLRFTIAPNAKLANWYLEVEHPLHDYLSLYELGPAGLRYIKTIGDRLPFHERSIKTTNLVFEIELDAQHEKTFFVRSHSESSMSFPILIWEPSAFQNQLVDTYLVRGFYYGMIGVMGLYNLFLFLTSRQKDYLDYVWYIWCSTCFQMALTGVAFHFLWPDSTWMANEGIAFLSGWFCVFLVRFTQVFLNTKLHIRKIHHTLNVIQMLGLGLVLFTVLGPYKFAIQIGNFLSLLTALVMIFVCASSVYYKIPQARFFVVAFITFFIGVVLAVLKISGVLPTNLITNYGYQVGSALQVVLLSIAVGDKTRIERLQAQRKIQQANSEIKTLNESLQQLNAGLEKKVQEKTQDLRKHTAQIETIMNSLPLGVVTVDKLAQIVQFSKWTAKFFEQDDLTNQSLLELLFKPSNLGMDDCEKIKSAIDAIVNEADIAFIANKAQLPSELRYQKSNLEHIIELSWDPIIDDSDQVETILLTINDVTVARQARLEAASKSRHLNMVGEILYLPADRFQGLIDNSYELLAEIDFLVKDQSPISDKTWQHILRNLHTIKGNSRTYGLSYLNQKIHSVESELVQHDANYPVSKRFYHIAKYKSEVIDLVQEYESIANVSLNRAVALTKEKLISRIHKWMSQKSSQLTQVSPKDMSEFISLKAELDQYCVINFNQAVQPLIKSLVSLARQLSRKVPKVDIIKGEEFLIEKDWAPYFESIFSHLFRNSMDHGFDETFQGKIKIEITVNETEVCLAYSDTGKGLNLKKLQSKYSRHQPGVLNWNRNQLAGLIFENQLSSRDRITDISGRGVGMGAVRQLVESANGQIKIVLEQCPADADYVPFSLILTFPKFAFKYEQLIKRASGA